MSKNKQVYVGLRLGKVLKDELQKEADKKNVTFSKLVRSKLTDDPFKM